MTESKEGVEKHTMASSSNKENEAQRRKLVSHTAEQVARTLKHELLFDKERELAAGETVQETKLHASQSHCAFQDEINKMTKTPIRKNMYARVQK